MLDEKKYFEHFDETEDEVAELNPYPSRFAELRRMRTPIDDSDNCFRTISKESILREFEMDSMLLSEKGKGLSVFSPIKTKGFLMSMVNSETNSPEKVSPTNAEIQEDFKI